MRPGTPTHAFRKWMRSFGWDETHQPWTWQRATERLHAPNGKDVDLQAHQLRRVWRQTKLLEWSKGDRREAPSWQRVASPLEMRAQIDHLDLEAARRAFTCTSTHGRSVLLGAVVGPVRKDERHQYKISLVLHLEHVAWTCRRFPQASSIDQESHSNFSLGVWLGQRAIWVVLNTFASFNGWRVCRRRSLRRGTVVASHLRVALAQFQGRQHRDDLLHHD